MKKKVGIVILFLTLLCSLAVARTLFQDEPAFCVGEKARYTIYYNLGFIWIHAGDVDFSVSKKKYKGEGRGDRATPRAGGGDPRLPRGRARLFRRWREGDRLRGGQIHDRRAERKVPCRA